MNDFQILWQPFSFLFDKIDGSGVWGVGRREGRGVSPILPASDH